MNSTHPSDSASGAVLEKGLEKGPEKGPGDGRGHRHVLHGRALGKTVDGPEGSLTILDGLEITVDAGEAVAIVGPSGSGKSTVLGILAGLDLPTSGEVELLGQGLGSLDEDQRARLRAGDVGFVFQNFQLLPGLSALENVMLPLELAGADDAAPRARQMLEEVGLAHRAGHQPLQLSGGEQQRVAIARALSNSPRVLLADEPTGNLDSNTGSEVMELLLDLVRESGKSLIVVTHDRRLASLGDRMITLADGRVVKGDEASALPSQA